MPSCPRPYEPLLWQAIDKCRAVGSICPITDEEPDGAALYVGGVSDELQSIIDSLATRVGRSVAVDDPHGRLLAHTSHVGAVDAVRTESILSRRAPDAAWSWAMSFRPTLDDRPTRVPPNPDLGMDARVGRAIRAQGAILGYLWVLDSDRELGDDELTLLESAADEAGAVLYRTRLLTELELGRERELLRDLLADGADLREHAANELLEANLFAPEGPIVAVVVQPVASDASTIDDEVRLGIGAALERVRPLASPRRRMHLVRHNHGLFVGCPSDRSLPDGGIEALGHRLRDELLKRLDADTWDVDVGIGAAHAEVVDVAVSYGEAQRALRVAQTVRGFGPVTSWDDLGIYRILTRLPADELAAGILHPGIARLLAAPSGEQLVSTLECYLDLAGDAKATAAKLFLHRTSLYYRLRRAEEIAGLDLRDGDDRLALHLGLKLARLTGDYPLSKDSAASSG